MIGLTLAALLVLLAGFAAWVLNSEAGARWVAARAVGMFDGKLQVASVAGRIAGPLTLRGVVYADAGLGVDTRVDEVSVDAVLSALLSRTVRVGALDASGVEVRLSEPQQQEEPPPGQFSLQPPIDIVLDRLMLRDARVLRDGEELIAIRSAEASGGWTAAQGVQIANLTVDAADGHVQLAGSVQDQDGYVGQLSGNFDWRAGPSQWAGDLTAASAGGQLTTNLRLRAPMSAQLDATIGQTGQMPWRFTLNVPQFDPRGYFLAEDGAIESLAAALTGEGDLTVAQLQGQVEANRQALRVEPARVRFADSVLTIEQLTLIDPAGRGTLNAEGSLRLGGENASPLNADLRVNWIDVQLPAEWVGQPLATRGEIKVLGSPEAFTANGQLALGPPDKLADIAIDIEGSTQRVQLRRLEVFQPRGSLAMQGEVQLQPAIGWQLDARAITFDPGALVAGWPGSIGFTLDTNGQIAPQGPSATLNLRNLNGRLRDRPISAQAQLSLNEQKVIAGTLRANSGNSSVSVTGRGGQALDLNANLDIASLEDWIPMAGGSVRGQFNVSGEWPGIAVKGAAHGSGLAYDGNAVKTVDVTADVSNPQAPSGTLKLAASDIAAKGLKFATAVLDAEGDEMSHAAHLLVSGEPLSGEARVQGARVGVDGWAGTVEQLSLEVADVAALALRAPAQVSFDPRQFGVSESCLTGDQISACIAATRDETGQIQARYTLEHLPLSLIAAVTMPDLPLHIDSVIEGNGDLRRTPEGELFGSAQLTSAMGSVSEVHAAADDAGVITGLEAEEALLSYQNLLVRAQLEGQTAHADMRMQFNGAGNAVAGIAVNNLSGASPVLDGNANITIADLSPLGLFVPQLAEVKGSGELKARIAGTLNAPA
ncbi:MAG: hypothetical protein LBE59_08380, partial [Nevskiaceae bacterium]|nr:hypothetical protein [Nevskiaceae bacterium]